MKDHSLIESYQLQLGQYHTTKDYTKLTQLEVMKIHEIMINNE